MKRTNPFRGAGTALVTPFTHDGHIDIQSLKQLVHSQIEGGIDFLCVLGTTAETPCLTASEKRLVMDTVLEANAGRLPLLLGAGTNCTAGVIEFLRTERLEGFDGVLIVAPYYNKPTQEGLYQHFRAVSEASPLPVVLYNVPGRTGINIEAATTLRIARDCPKVVAIKEASGRIAQIEEIIREAPEGFEVLSGDDAITFELMTIGASGVISVITNAYPEAFSTMIQAASRGHWSEALSIHRGLAPCYKLLSVDGNPAGIKDLLSVLGMATNQLRLPLVPASAQTHAALEAFVKAYAERP